MVKELKITLGELTKLLQNGGELQKIITAQTAGV